MFTHKYSPSECYYLETKSSLRTIFKNINFVQMANFQANKKLEITVKDMCEILEKFFGYSNLTTIEALSLNLKIVHVSDYDNYFYYADSVENIYHIDLFEFWDSYFKPINLTSDKSRKKFFDVQTEIKQRLCS